MDPSFILTIFAGLLLLIAWIWLLVAAFRTSVIWGLVLFFLGWTLIPVIIFAARNWSDAKRPVFLYAAGLGLSAVAYILVFATIGADLDSVVADGVDPITAEPSETGAETSLPTPRPSPMPTHPSWEEVVSEMNRETDVGWETLVPTPTPAAIQSSVLSWDELGAHVGETVIVELRNSSVIEATLEETTTDRVRVQTSIGSGEASYWIERKTIVLIRLAN